MKFDDDNECIIYFARRFTELKNETLKANDETERQMLKGLKQAQREINKKLEAFYARFAETEEISLEAAKRLLTSDEIDQFRRDVDLYIDWLDAYGADPELDKALVEASLSYRISRLQAIELELQVLVEQGYSGMGEILTRRLEEVYSDNYYKTAYEIFKGFEVGTSFQRVDTNRLKHILTTPWLGDGFDYLDRIEINKMKLQDALPRIMTKAVTAGWSYTKASEELGKAINTSAHNASAALVTESAYISTMAQNDMFKELGVERYEIIATLDTVTSEICQDMDGKIYKMDELLPGVTAPPFHPRCRTVTAPYFDDSDLEGYEDIGRAARNKEGKTYIVPSDWNYDRWAKEEGITPVYRSDK